MFRIPATFLYVYAFSVSILAGFGSSFLINAISDLDSQKFNKLVKFLIMHFHYFNCDNNDEGKRKDKTEAS